MKKKINYFLKLAWTIWCSFVILTITIIYIPAAFILVNLGNKNLNKQVEMFSYKIAGIIMLLWGIIPIYNNKKVVDFNKHQVFVGNHRSYLDAFMVVYGIKCYKKFIGMHKVFDWFIIGYFAKKFNHIAVKREDDKNRTSSFDSIVKEAKLGNSVCFFPEGRIVMTPELIHDFWNGAFKVAIKLQIPIVPFTLIDTGVLFPPDSIRIRPGLSRCYWHEPISTKGLTLNDLPKLKEKVKNLILNKLLEHFPSGNYPINFNSKKWKYNGFYYEKIKS